MTRRYEQRLRADAAAETRRRILEAVYARLREAPSEPVSVDLVARLAGVSRSTVYVTFGSRAGLFEAVAADFLERSGLQELVEAVSHPDARESMRLGFRAGCRMYAADRDIARALYAMARLDHEAVGGAIRNSEQRRIAGVSRLARRLEEQGHLRAGVDRAEAREVLWVLTSFESFDLLHHDRELPVEEAARVLVDTAERALLIPPGV